MLHKGEWVEVRDSDLHEAYIAQVEKEHDESSGVSPLVKVAYCLEYPRQTAIIHPDILKENRPVPDGEILRLPFVRRCNAPPGTYASGLDRARKRAEAQARAEHREDVLSILKRHAQGEYNTIRRYCRG